MADDKNQEIAQKIACLAGQLNGLMKEAVDIGLEATVQVSDYQELSNKYETPMLQVSLQQDVG